MEDSRDIEARFRWIASSAVILFGITLAAGLALYIAVPDGAISTLVLDTGLVLVMAAPAVRLLLAVAERVRRRDWTFVAMSAAVVVELSIVLWRAAQKM